ncbi:MAG: hypothetical protein HC880_07675 [Bacteroidia bacterium]|nr:hypothetical protein [Bacteroidia bacterium]
MGDQSTVTDEYGHFFFENKTMNARGALVKVEKSGYFPGSRRFFPVSGQENRVKVELLAQSFDLSFETQTGAKLTLNNGAAVDFAPNSIRQANGDLYQGTVQVAMKWLDPSSLRTLDQMPGDLQGVNLRNEEVALRTFGMMAVELRGESGEALNIAKDRTATLTMPVPSELLADAPAEIPLWYFNETYGLWVEESKATLQNGQYMGEVSHFSFWNCDVPFPLVKVQFQLKDQNGQILPNYRTTIEQPNQNGRISAGYSNKNGVVSGLIPRGEALVLKVFDICDEEIYQKSIGPFNEDTDLGVVTVDNSQVTTIVLRGKLVNCEQEPVENALLIAELDGRTIYEYTKDGSFELVLTSCSNGQAETVKLKGIDLTSLLQSKEITVTPGTAPDLGNISICDRPFTSFIRVRVDDVEAVYPAIIVVNDSSGTQGFSYIHTIGNNNQNYAIGFGFSDKKAGDYSSPNLSFLEVFYDNIRGWSIRGNFSSFIVTEFGSAGEAVKGTFRGEMLNYGNGSNTPDTVTVSGEFDIIR